MNKTIKTVITFGTYDLFHVGHLRILERAKTYGDRLIVGVSTDELNFQKKNVYPIYTQTDRLEIIKSIKYVDEVFLEESLEQKAAYIQQFKADLLVMGSDWAEKFDEFKNICEVVYLPRTEQISTTLIKYDISNRPVKL